MSNTSLIPAHMTTLRDVIRLSTSLMNEYQCYFGHGTDNALDEAVALVLGALHLPPDLHHDFFSAQLTTQEHDHLNRLLAKRIHENIPVAYLTGKAWFMNLPFHVTPDVLIPRSPLAEEISRHLSPWVTDPEAVHSILDLCTGSGCIGIACAYQFINAHVTLADISAEALQIANKNIALHGLEEVVETVQSDVFSALTDRVFDLIISNPPYVPPDEMRTLPTEYQHEPCLGLIAEDNGLAIVKRILLGALTHLSENGLLIVEVGNTQIAMESTFEALPLTWLHFERGGHGVFMIDAPSLRLHAALIHAEFASSLK